MSSSLNGVGGARGAGQEPRHPIPAAGSGSPGHSVVRVTPIAPADGAGAAGQAARQAGSLLGSSGVGLDALLGATDWLEARQTSSRGEVAMGLEQARSSLLKMAPADALAALDSIWNDAYSTEEGWYLRAGALTALGLPGEADRVADQGLSGRPGSLALRYMQGLSRSVIGDWHGAKAASTAAIEMAPDDPLLRLQNAVIQAATGHRDRARELVLSVSRQYSGHPAIDWAKAMISTLSANRTRESALRTAKIPSGEYAVVDGETPQAPVPSAGASTGLDQLDEAFVQLGRRIAVVRAESSGAEGTFETAAADLRRALSAGGVFSGQYRPEQLHAARHLLGLLLDGRHSSEIAAMETVGEGSTRPAVRSMVSSILNALREGDSASVERHWRHARPALPADAASLMARFLAGAGIPADSISRWSGEGIPGSGGWRLFNDATLAANQSDPDGSMGSGRGAPGVRSGRDIGVMQPIRFGLALLAGRAEDANATRNGTGALSAHFEAEGPLGDEVRLWYPAGQLDQRNGPTTASGQSIPDIESKGAGWGPAAAMAGGIGRSAGYQSDQRDPVWHEPDGNLAGNEGFQKLLAVVCVALAIVAGMTGHNAAAVALAAGAAWLSIRRASGRGERLTDGAETRGGERLGRSAD